MDRLKNKSRQARVRTSFLGHVHSLTATADSNEESSAHRASGTKHYSASLLLRLTAKDRDSGKAVAVTSTEGEMSTS